MIKNLILSILVSISVYGVEVAEVSQSAFTTTDTTSVKDKKVDESVKVFGHNLFNGSFSNPTKYRYNPEYRISIGDTINIKMWGAFDFASKTTVDSKGNIFIPKVGVVKVVGIKNEALNWKVKTTVKRVFKKSVFSYADLESFQSVSIFVTGAVNKPGLYDGLSSDSIIQFIDKAKGIDSTSGSYRNIKVLRKNKTKYTVDLYDFMISGSLKLFQFHMGDVIVVDAIKNYIEITGDVKRPYRFELKDNTIKLDKVLKAVLPNPTLTNFTVTKFNKENEKIIQIYPIKENLDMLLHSGDSVDFIPDNSAKQIKIEISGEHLNTHTLIVDKGTTLQDVYETIQFSEMSDKLSFQLFRQSIAAQQKALLFAQLNDLEAKTLTAGSVSTEEAIIRKQEAALVLNFIERAKKAEPKGQVVINANSDLSQVYLEDGDNIFIPKKSNMIVIQGEVMLPGAQTYVAGLSFDEYMDSCGGFSYNADTEKVLIIKPNGKVTAYDADSFGSSYEVQAGDAILVLGNIDSKHLQVVKDITQIVYQIAVSAAVVLTF